MIGPYRFTETDAKRTVRFADEIFDLYARGSRRRRSSSISVRAAPTGELEADLAAVWSAWTSAGPALRAAGQLPATRRGRRRTAQRVAGRLAEAADRVRRGDLDGNGRRSPGNAPASRPAVAGAVHLERRGDRRLPRAPAIRWPRVAPARTSRSAACRGPRCAPEFGCGSATVLCEVSRLRAAVQHQQAVVHRRRLQRDAPRPWPGQPGLRDGAGTGRRSPSATQRSSSRRLS